MPKPRPPGLHREVNRHGKTVWYYRVGKGPRVRIDGTFGSPEFKAAYDAAALGAHVDRPARATPAGRKIGDKEEMVYFIVADGRVKIGYSVDPPKRLEAMRAGISAEARIVRVEPGGRALEREMHRRFASLRVHGEWFRLAGDLAAFLDEGPGEIVL